MKSSKYLSPFEMEFHFHTHCINNLMTNTREIDHDENCCRSYTPLSSESVAAGWIQTGGKPTSSAHMVFLYVVPPPPASNARFAGFKGEGLLRYGKFAAAAQKGGGFYPGGGFHYELRWLCKRCFCENILCGKCVL